MASILSRSKSFQSKPERKLLKQEIDTACEQYDGTWFQPCQILVVGEVVAANAPRYVPPQTGTRKAAHLTLVTAVGIAETKYKGVFQSVVTLDDLLREQDTGN